MKKNYAESIDDLISKLLSIYTDDKIKEILEKLKTVLDEQEDFADVFLTISKKHLNEKTRFEFLIIFGIILEIEEFLETAKQIYDKNPVVVDNYFQKVFESFQSDFILIKNSDIILLFGELLEKIYANGFEFVGRYIVSIYNNLEAGYSKPLIFRILKNCGKVYSWKDFEAVELYKTLNSFISESQYKGTNYEKAVSLFYKGLFIKDYVNKNLEILELFYGDRNYNNYFKRSYELGNSLAKSYIEEYENYNDSQATNFNDFYDDDDNFKSILKNKKKCKKGKKHLKQ